MILLILGLSALLPILVWWGIRDFWHAEKPKEIPEKFDAELVHRLEIDCGIIPKCGICGAVRLRYFSSDCGPGDIAYPRPTAYDRRAAYNTRIGGRDPYGLDKLCPYQCVQAVGTYQGHPLCQHGHKPFPTGVYDDQPQIVYWKR